MTLLYVMKPDAIYDSKKKQFRQFGTGDSKTLLPIYVVGILMAVILYVLFNQLAKMYGEPVQDLRTDTKIDPKIDTKTDTQIDPKTDPRINSDNTQTEIATLKSQIQLMNQTINQMSQMNQLNQLNQMNQMNQLNQLNQLSQLNQMSQNHNHNQIPGHRTKLIRTHLSDNDVSGIVGPSHLINSYNSANSANSANMTQSASSNSAGPIRSIEPNVPKIENIDTMVDSVLNSAMPTDGHNSRMPVRVRSILPNGFSL